MKTPRHPKLELTCRARPSRRLRDLILEAQNFACLACGRSLEEIQFDHIVALGLGGGNTPDNWAALCRACHKKKTRLDLKRIAKANRQRRYHETGRSRAQRTYGPAGRAKGFDRGLRKHLNGVVRPRCWCQSCRKDSGAPEAQ